MASEAIYKGTTRPAMLLGVPLVPLVVMLGTSLLLVMWVGSLGSWWILPIVLVAIGPTWLWMRYVTHKDDQRFRQMFLAIRLRLRDRNRGLWASRSYASYPYRGARHVRHR